MILLTQPKMTRRRAALSDDIKYEIVMAELVNNFPKSEISPLTCADSLEDLAQRIKERDAQLEDCARTNWLANGCDLLRAKEIVRHGNFEAWCKKELGYSKSKAEKLMNAAKMFGVADESVIITDFLRPTLAYALSAPSLPAAIKDAFVPRLLAGENVVAEAQAKIKRHREEVKDAKQATVSVPDVQISEAHSDGTVGHPNAVQVEEGQGAGEGHAAQAAALDLLKTRMGDELAELLTLAAAAGPETIFAANAFRELQEHAAALPADHAPVEADGAANITANQTFCDDNVLTSTAGNQTAPGSLKPVTLDRFDIPVAPSGPRTGKRKTFKVEVLRSRTVNRPATVNNGRPAATKSSTIKAVDEPNGPLTSADPVDYTRAAPREVAVEISGNGASPEGAITPPAEAPTVAVIAQPSNDDRGDPPDYRPTLDQRPAVSGLAPRPTVSAQAPHDAEEHDIGESADAAEIGGAGGPPISVSDVDSESGEQPAASRADGES